MSEFDIFFDDYENKHNCSPEKYECFEAGQQSQQGEVDKLQTEIDELQARIDEALIEMKNQLGDEDFYDMERPDYDAMLYALRNIKDILKGNKDEN